LSSLFEYLCDRNAITHNPVKGRKRRRQDTSARRPSGTRAAHRTRR
jgi:hypothetical protein